MTGTVNINIDDTVLVEQAQHGSSAAMERLILKYQNRIYNIILKICSNPEDAAELTQETFVKVMENISKFQGRSGFYTWIFRIAVNLTLSYCKRSVKLGFVSLDAELNDNDSQAKGSLKDILSDRNSPCPDIVAQNSELCQLVLRALMQLDASQRTVVILRDIEDMNYAQIADVLDIELGTVKSRLSRARNNIREILESVL